MRRAVYEVGVGDQGGGEAHDGAVETHDEDFGVGVEGLGDVKIVCYAVWRGRDEEKSTVGLAASFFEWGAFFCSCFLVSSNVAPVGWTRWTRRRQRRFRVNVQGAHPVLADIFLYRAVS